MGLSPREVDRLSIWEYLAALDGYSQAHDPDSSTWLSEGEIDDLWNVIKLAS